jgi:hypothetical protein
MRDHTAQRPVYLIRVAQGQSRVADLEAFNRAAAALRSSDVPFKVVEAYNGDLGEHSVFVIAEEYKDQAFDLALENRQPNVIYLSFDRVAYLYEDTNAVGGKVLGEFKAVNNYRDYQGEYFLDHNRNQAYAIA